ncbi:MAG: ABC transporter ATP-binding protein [Verrucomicrobia bacterium]|nr:ABC transporter ATP-binding protein [Verrucomicrobiota bacterium]
MIRTEDLSMQYGQLKALNGLNLEIEQGEFFAFLGPNAAGKTTTIKLLTGLLRPTRGRAWICGHDIQEDPIAAKKVLGFVPDVALFYDKLTALEFMRFIADIFSLDHARASKLTGILFEQFALESYRHELIENLSHGTRQRLAIAAALLHEPRVIIIDEPMIGLDPVHAKIVKDELKRRANDGVTIFMSTHLLNIAQDLADRIGIINHGELVALGTMDELKTGRTDDGHDQLENIFLEMLESGAGTEPLPALPAGAVVTP